MFTSTMTFGNGGLKRLTVKRHVVSFYSLKHKLNDLKCLMMAKKQDEDYLIVKVPLTFRNQYLMRNFRSLLNDYEQQVQNVRKKSRIRYKVAAKIPSITFKKH